VRDLAYKYRSITINLAECNFKDLAHLRADCVPPARYRKLTHLFYTMKIRDLLLELSANASLFRKRWPADDSCTNLF
jgi:hypothetical protein